MWIENFFNPKVQVLFFVWVVNTILFWKRSFVEVFLHKDTEQKRQISHLNILQEDDSGLLLS